MRFSSIRYGVPPESRFAKTSIARKDCNHSATSFFNGSASRQKAFLMRILYCNKYNYPFSGTEVYLLELMELMREQGHDVALFSMADERGKASSYDRHLARRVDFKEKTNWWQKA